MKLILFGAGASFGATSVLPANPPLGSGLYSQLRERFPNTWGALPKRLDSLFRNSFEDGMGQVWNDGSHSIPILMQHMAIFFAQFRLSGDKSDTYSRIINDLDKAGKLNSVVFSSLNYDVLLEIALTMAGRQINYFGDYTESALQSTVWKLHGSCNFLPGKGIQATRGISYGKGVVFETGIKAVNPDEVSKSLLGNTSLYPAMSIFTEGKPVQTSPGIINKTRESWERAVKTAESISLIGVNPHMVDSHIWDELGSTKSSIYIVGNEQSNSEWMREHRSGPTQIVGNKFSKYIDELVTAI